VPVRIALIGVCNLQYSCLAERAALDLEADRQAVTIEPAGHADSRQPHVVDRSRVGRQDIEGLDGARRAGVDIGLGEWAP